MKERWLIFIMFMMVFLMPQVGIAQGPGPVRNLESPTHRLDMPADYFQIKMRWDPPDSEDVAGYFYRFDTNPDHAFDGLNTVDAFETSDTNVTSQNFIKSENEYVTCHFHIAAFDGDGEIGVTTSVGPYFIHCISGDIDGDGKISSQDCLLALKIAAGSMADDVNPNADVDGDAEIGVPEAVHILRILAGYSPESLKECCSVPESNIATVRYTYDDLNRLVRVVYDPEEEGEQTEISHMYDETGNRKTEEVICK